MAATLEELEQRVSRLEAELAGMKRTREPSLFGPVPPERQAALSRMFRDALREMDMDITGRVPPPLPELRRRMIEHGVRPEDRLISTGIRELHGEDDGDEDSVP